MTAAAAAGYQLNSHVWMSMLEERKNAVGAEHGTGVNHASRRIPGMKGRHPLGTAVPPHFCRRERRAAPQV